MRQINQAVRRTAKRGPPRSHADELNVAAAVVSGQERDTMWVRVYRALARGLMAGRFKPGEAVTLRRFAKRLGTSAMPVRDAVSRLIAERALVLLPNRSVIVPRMSRARFSQLSRVRETLEGTLAEIAAARATPALLRRLAETNDAMKRCVAQDDFHAALAHNLAFHFTLYESASEEVVLPLIEMLWLRRARFSRFR